MKLDLYEFTVYLFAAICLGHQLGKACFSGKEKQAPAAQVVPFVKSAESEGAQAIVEETVSLKCIQSQTEEVNQ